VLLGLNPLLGLATLATWLIIAAFFRYSSLAAIAAAVFAPFYQMLIWGGGAALLPLIAMSLLLLWRHGGNMRKLINGTEGRIGQKAASAAPAARAAGANIAPAAGASMPHRGTGKKKRARRR
jgi:glycerol-3-phosphate acyltransferase PlsY